MFDSINVAAIPADATDVLGYSDGANANIPALKARFPNARIHTISAVGQLLAEWVDCEPGCVWPPPVAAAVLRAWQPSGCKGIYASLDNMPAVKEAVNTLMLQNVEYFDADATNIMHVDPGYVATQYGQTAGYDETDTTNTFEGITDPPPGDDEDMKIYTLNGGEFLSNGLTYRWLENPTDAGYQTGATNGGAVPNAEPMGYPMTAVDAHQAGDGRQPVILAPVAPPAPVTSGTVQITGTGTINLTG